jgi:hypothetical protein
MKDLETPCPLPACWVTMVASGKLGIKSEKDFMTIKMDPKS